MMEKVFIAGGTGMLGAATAQAFADAGTRVVVSSRKDRDPVGERLEAYSDLIKMEKVDLLDHERVAEIFAAHKFDGMVMLAQAHQHALTRADNNRIYPIVLNTFEIARKNEVKRVILGGSFAIYSGMKPPLNEDVKFSAETKDVGIVRFEVATKRALEIIALDYGTEFEMGLSILPDVKNPEPHDLEVLVLRSPMMFGPGYYALGSPLGAGAHFAAGRLANFKDHIGYGGRTLPALWKLIGPIPTSYVKDSANSIQIAMNADFVKRRIYNLSSNFPRNSRQQLEALLAVAPQCKDTIGISPDELPDTNIDLGYTGARFEEDYDWTPGYTLETALEDYLAWLKDNEI